MMAQEHAQVMTVGEVATQARRRRFDGSTRSFLVRVTGRVVRNEVATNGATIEWKRSTLLVDTRHVDRFSYPLSTLVQIIGDVNYDRENPPTVVARMVRSVQGMDMELFETSLGLMRSFMSKLAVCEGKQKETGQRAGVHTEGTHSRKGLNTLATNHEPEQDQEREREQEEDPDVMIVTK
eukprot:TRINITY_DN7756_c0_g1_i1.p1 TRINITY_DN7756_c0_g1~~TRINITY_DN7756_c0_g1_i1.p1  ORF type:complete len:180 (+),score=32.64 TRINITY_DN7756_c0_g1_i1:234-773(+)